MIGWLIGGAWALCSLLAFRVILRAGIHDLGPDLDAASFLGLLFVAICMGAMGGPFVLAWRIFMRATGNTDFASVARALAGESRADKVKRLEHEAEQRERRIRDLERELDLA